MARARLWRRVFDALASVRLAVPLLIAIAMASIAGGFIPQGQNVGLGADVPPWVGRINDYLRLNDIFHSRWYIGLLGTLGVCLLAITAKRVPLLWSRAGPGAGVGILLAHIGILLILAGAMYGGLSGFRYYTRAVEGDVTVLPPLPFVIKLDQLDVRYYPPGTFARRGPNIRMVERQESMLTLFQQGVPFVQRIAAPGRPLVARGVTLLPSERDIGWAFDLVITAPNGKEKTIPIRPWAPPLITLGYGNDSKILAHRLALLPSVRPGGADEIGSLATEVFMLEDNGSVRSLGHASTREPLQFGEWTFSVETVRRFTGLHVYSRPERPFLAAGVTALLVGLSGYFTRWGRRLRSREAQPGSGPRTDSGLPEEA